jgi:hypothetical protein
MDGTGRNPKQLPELSELLLPYALRRSLRSENLGLLNTPRYRLEAYGGKTFSVRALRLWNCLPTYIKEPDSLTVFKSLLKTYLFSVAIGQ